MPSTQTDRRLIPGGENSRLLTLCNGHCFQQEFLRYAGKARLFWVRLDEGQSEVDVFKYATICRPHCFAHAVMHLIGVNRSKNRRSETLDLSGSTALT